MNRSNETSSNLKLISLIVLIVQTTALVLTLRYSQTQKTDGPKYISSTAVVCAEIIKLFTCFLVIFRNNNYRLSGMISELDREIFSTPQTRLDSLKVAVPAVLYVVQNNLLFFALKKLDAATYQVTYQLKILTTALFSVSLLGKSLNRFNWAALILLTAGVALVQYPSGDAKPSAIDHDTSDNILGLCAVLAACFSSGFAGVYFEKILKTSKVSLWIRNIQLAFFSVFGSFFVCWLYDWEGISNDGFLRGYNTIIWIVVLLQAYGGLVIALVVKYADNILKGFAVSLSIILSSLTSWLILRDLTITLTFAIGATIVIFATFLYGYEPKTYHVIHKA